MKFLVSLQSQGATTYMRLTVEQLAVVIGRRSYWSVTVTDLNVIVGVAYGEESW